MSSKVSIIIACYNDPDVIKAVDSALKQTYPNKEVIVIDDGSNPTVAKLIDSLENDVDLVIRQGNSGQSFARNHGIKKATGDYILNLDSDDFFEPSFCEKALVLMENDPEIKVVCCKARRFSKAGEVDIYSPAGGDFKNFLTFNAALGSSMFRKADWETCGGYEEKLPILGFEDWELYLNILKRGGRAEVINEVLFNYQVGKNSTTTRIRHLKQEKYRQIVFKHKELYKEHFEILVDELFKRIKKEEKEKNRIANKPDSRVGNKLLAPFRIIKKIWS
ncbi:glycosyltransferase [Christiangramia sp. ASW11-125]|uniref:glycosyltransferase n=1 Tax=Christiangramia sp. ASW11-125 TaxID=3400701 RepID=UPI003AAED0D0